MFQLAIGIDSPLIVIIAVLLVSGKWNVIPGQRSLMYLSPPGIVSLMI